MDHFIFEGASWAITKEKLRAEEKAPKKHIVQSESRKRNIWNKSKKKILARSKAEKKISCSESLPNPHPPQKYNGPSLSVPHTKRPTCIMPDTGLS